MGNCPLLISSCAMYWVMLIVVAESECLGSDVDDSELWKPGRLGIAALLAKLVDDSVLR